MKVLRNSLYALNLVRGACPSYIPWTLLAALTGVTAPLTGVLGIKLLIDALIARDTRSTGLILLAFALLTAATALFRSWYNTVYEPAARTRIGASLSASLLERIGLLDLSAIENSAFYNRCSRAVSEANTRPQGVVQTLCGLVGNLLSLATLTAILLSLDPFVLLLTSGGAALMFVLNLKRSRLGFKQYLERTVLERQVTYIQRVYYEPQYARELRLFAMNPFLVGRYRNAACSLRQTLQRQGLHMWVFSGLEKLLNDCLFVVITLSYLVTRFFAGAISIGGFSALFNGIFQFGDQLYSLLARVPQLYEHSLYLETVQDVLQANPDIEVTEGLTLEASRAHSIEFCHVTFAYPGCEPVFRDLSLTIAAGEQVALLGHNGAGKSTLVRLLLRFYDPQEGRILIDGVDIRRYDIRALRRCFAVVMQDFQHYAFSLAENIALGRPAVLAQDIETAVRQARLDDRVGQLPRGLETAITREFSDSGIQLSGGEYQKLALARAYAQESSILLFDEPSSALDPEAEHTLFASLRRTAGRKTVLFICHKMSLAVHADRVILFERGRIAEQGTPLALLRSGGLYSRLYQLQAKDYLASF
ncbi:MAG: ABC transporter ATP-binding protein [Clostridiaceae bacterium]|nr:ABC transporter ATP-binding protein [Clostridiaceae bacterium]